MSSPAIRASCSWWTAAEEHIDAAPGDFVYVPAWVPHREENPSDYEDAVVVLARSTPEEIVVNLPSLRSVDGIPGASE